MQVRCDEGRANRIGPEPCVGTREGDSEASVGERIGQPWSRENLNNSGADVFRITAANTDGRVIASVRPDVPCAGTGRSRVWPAGKHRGSASGRRGVEADDARTREV